MKNLTILQKAGTKNFWLFIGTRTVAWLVFLVFLAIPGIVNIIATWLTFNCILPMSEADIISLERIRYLTAYPSGGIYCFPSFGWE